MRGSTIYCICLNNVGQEGERKVGVFENAVGKQFCVYLKYCICFVCICIILVALYCAYNLLSLHWLDVRFHIN